MLSMLFGEPPGRENEAFSRVIGLLDDFNRQLRKKYQHQSQVDNKWVRLDLWATGLQTALRELEQSLYCCRRFAKLVHSDYVDVMPGDERDNYYRHVYFYKDAFIRLFSLLDKTGFFLDCLFELRTGSVKQRFSYFTVLRQMHKTDTHSQLEQRLFNLKVKYREPMDRLRRKRNLEIHSLNAELIDDNWRAGSTFVARMKIEPIAGNMEELQQGMDMVCQSLTEIFRYSKGVLR